MFTREEQPLLTGSPGEIEVFVDCDRCMIVDWRASEDELLDDVVRFLPEGLLTYETLFPDDETVDVRLRFRGKEDAVVLPFQPQNQFRVLLRVRELLQPEYDIKLFRCTDGSDTQGFLVRKSEWWRHFRGNHSERHDLIFREVSDLTELWDLDGEEEVGEVIRPREIRVKPWWKFW